MLKIACVLAAIAGFGLIGGAVGALTVDAKGGTTAGTIAAISAGVLFALAYLAFIANFYRGRTMPVEEEEASPSKEKPSSSKQKPSPSKP
jgi:uncharacterized membrane protein YebE (DUF533 family)